MLFLDTTNSRLVASATSVRAASAPTFTVGDTASITVRFLARTGSFPLYSDVDESENDIVMSLGAPAAQPTAGTFPLTWGGNTASLLPVDISQYALSAVLNALASVIAAGGVTVEGDIGGPFTVTFLVNGARAPLTSAANALFPAATVTIVDAQTGTATNPSVQLITLAQTVAAQVTEWTPQAAAAILVESINANIEQQVFVPVGTYGGTFTLTTNGNTTPGIPYSAQFDLVEEIINALPGITGATVAAVTGPQGQNGWDITIPGWTHAFTGSATGLRIPLTLTGSLDLTTPQVAALLDGCSSAQVPIYIQATASGIQTLYSGLVTLQLP